jgi:chromosome segregation ATPase
MARKILAWMLIVLSGIFLFASIAGMVAVWVYNEPLTRDAITELKSVDVQLAEAQATLTNSEKELERALRIVDATQSALDKLMNQSNSADNLLDTIQNTLDDRLLPELKTTRDRIDSARVTLQQLQSLLAGLQGFIPGVDLSAPDKILVDLISSANSLDAEITSIEALGKQASLFVSDTSFLLGGDLTSTRDSLEMFLTAIQEYETKVAGWREQVTYLLENTSKWIDQASIALTIFFLWFGVSQFGLLMHGLNILRGGDPFLVLRPRRIEIHTDGEVEAEHTESLN